jgi:cell division protein FtsQ
VRAAAWLLPAAGGVGVASWLFGALLQAELLAVQHIVVRGNVRLTSGEVQALLDGIRGENIFQVDFDRYRRRVMDSPWVADVTLGRILPATIEVRVVERTPLAIARLGEQLYLVDDTGIIIDEYGAQYRDFDLPIVDGLVSVPSTTGPLVDRGRVQLTSAFLQALRSQPDLGRRLSQMDVSNAHDAVVMFDHDSVWLHLGESRFIERLRTYLELVPMLNEHFREIDYIDLRFDNRVFVRSHGRGARDDQRTRQVENR